MTNDVCHLCWDNTSYPHHAEGQNKLAASVRINFLKDNRRHRISTSVFVTLCVIVGQPHLVRVTVPASDSKIDWSYSPSDSEVRRKFVVEWDWNRSWFYRLNLLRLHYLLWGCPCDMRPLSASTFIGLLHARRCQFTRGCSVCHGCCRHDEHFRNICILTQIT